MEKIYTLEEYYNLKERVISLRQSAVAAQGSEAHAIIWEELRKLEEELVNAKVISINDRKIEKIFTPSMIQNMHEHKDDMNINKTKLDK